MEEKEKRERRTKIKSEAGSGGHGLKSCKKEEGPGAIFQQ